MKLGDVSSKLMAIVRYGSINMIFKCALTLSLPCPADVFQCHYHHRRPILKSDDRPTNSTACWALVVSQQAVSHRLSTPPCLDEQSYHDKLRRRLGFCPKSKGHGPLLTGSAVCEARHRLQWRDEEAKSDARASERRELG